MAPIEHRADLTSPPSRAAISTYQTTTTIRFPRILLVSNHRSFGLHLREALSFHHLSAVIEQEPSAEATLRRLSAIGRWKVRLVLIALPLLQGGLDLISDIRYRSQAPSVPLVSIDRTPSAVEVSHALRLGADGCLAMPEDWQSYGPLAQRLHQLLVLHEREELSAAEAATSS
jgi:DNA-binding NarL/FixJ family response regulator